MLRPLPILLLAALAWALAGFAVSQSPVGDPAEIPQPTLEISPLTIAGDGETEHIFSVELANDPDEIRIGLMLRESLAADAGMLFDLGPRREANFWMKDTLIPLDMLFIDVDGTILAIAENTIPGSLRQVGPGVPVKAVLELNAGTAAGLDIAPGDTVRHAIFGNADGGE